MYNYLIIYTCAIIIFPMKIVILEVYSIFRQTQSNHMTPHTGDLPTTSMNQHAHLLSSASQNGSSHYQLVSTISTSSIAQDGGGSFKNRKPIGEVGCCESQMVERIHWWTERWLELCFLEWLQWLQWSPGRSPHPQLLDVVWCSAAVVVVVVWWSCSCGVV